MTEVAETAKDPKCWTEAQSSVKAVRNYKFAVTLRIWYNLLKRFSRLFCLPFMASKDVHIRRFWQCFCCS